jgi:hypothetical protein
MLTRHAPTVRTKFLFTAIVDDVAFDRSAKTVSFRMRDDHITYTKVDSNCNISVAAVDAAFHSISDTPMVTIATPTDILTNIPLSEKATYRTKSFFGRAHHWIDLSFHGSDFDADKLRKGTLLQVYAVNLNLPCE